MRGRACHLNRCRSRRTRYHVLLSDSANVKEQVSVFVSAKKVLAQPHLQTLVSSQDSLDHDGDIPTCLSTRLRVEITLQPTVSQSSRQAPSGPEARILLPGHRPWRQVEAVIYRRKNNWYVVTCQCRHVKICASIEALARHLWPPASSISPLSLCMTLWLLLKQGAEICHVLGFSDCSDIPLSSDKYDNT
jgi:hypothetical protein